MLAVAKAGLVQAFEENCILDSGYFATLSDPVIPG